MSSIQKTHPGLIDNGNSAGLSPISVGGKPLLTPLPPKTPSFDESVVDERLRTVKQSEKDKNTPEYDQVLTIPYCEMLLIYAEMLYRAIFIIFF